MTPPTMREALELLRDWVKYSQPSEYDYDVRVKTKAFLANRAALAGEAGGDEYETLRDAALALMVKLRHSDKCSDECVALSEMLATPHAPRPAERERGKQ